MQLNPGLTFLSPATIFFVLLSSAVQCLALRQYFPFPFQEEAPHYGITVPQRLVESSRLHLRVLSTLSAHSDRWQHDLVMEIHRLLSYCTSRAQHHAGSQDQTFTATNLMRYRWCGSGTGILPLSPTAARQEWHFSSLPDEIWAWPSGQEEVLRNPVTELCDPSIRMCQPKYFDLSHYYAHSFLLGADGSLLCHLTLNGQDNQAIRFRKSSPCLAQRRLLITLVLLVINRFQRSLVAIGESGCPLLHEILPLAGIYPSILSALLALAARLRAPSGSERPGPGSTGDNPIQSDTESPSFEALSWHQATISGILSKLLHIQGEQMHEDDLKEILAASLLLTMFGFPHQIDNWSLHVQGMISLVESTDPAMVESLSVARLVRAFAAHNDISAFSLGRSDESHRAWLNWDITPREGIVKSNFSPFEIIIGYPETMITLIAIMSSAFEDTRKFSRLSTSLYARLKHAFDNATATTRLPLLCDSNGVATSSGVSWHTMVEFLLESWRPPPTPQHLSFHLSADLLTAWECIRKAALIYLWRGGFDADATKPLEKTHATTAQSYLRQLLYNIDGLLDLTESKRITVANAMLWTLVVVGNECCREIGMRKELLRVLTRAQQYFSITHLEHVIRLLGELWSRVDALGEGSAEADQGWSQPMNLQMLARDMDLCVPLF